MLNNMERICSTKYVISNKGLLKNLKMPTNQNTGAARRNICNYSKIVLHQGAR
jgi:hypothetical protein